MRTRAAIAAVLLVLLLAGPAGARERVSDSSPAHATQTNLPATEAPKEANQAGLLILVLVVVGWTIPFTVAITRARRRRSRLEEQDGA